MNADIAIAILRESVVADENAPSGLRWLERPPHHFPNSGAHRAWNARYAGAVAGSPDASGVFGVDLDGHHIVAYRALYALRHHGVADRSGARRSPPSLPPESTT